MTTLAEHIIVAGVENRPPMLEKSMYDSWASRIRLFIKRKKHGRMMLDSIDNGPLVYPTIEEDGQTRPKKYSELTEAQQLQDDSDVQETNIILHGLPPDVYALVNHQETAKDISDKFKLLMKGTELSYQERECRLYNLFDKFASIQGETLYEYYWRFSQLINDMHTIGMTMQQVQVNTKFLNALPPEWSKFVTDVKLAKSLYTTNYDQLYAYLSQHERHANEVRLMRERYLDPLALVANSQTLYNPSQSPQCSVPLMHPPPQQFTPVYAAPIHHQQHHTPQGEDSIDCINKAMSSNLRNRATIQDARVIVQQVQSRQTQSFAGTRNRGIDTTLRGNYAASQPRAVKCYNYKGEWHMARQCTQPKRPRNSAWFKDKLMLVEAQEAGQISDEEQLAFIANPRIEEAQVAQQTIPQNLAFQTEDLDAYDSDCDDISSAKAVLMANLLSCDSDVLSEVVKKRTTSNAIKAGAWGFKHTKACFLTEIIPFIKILKDTFNAFDKTLLDEITKVQNVFNQMEVVVDQCSVFSIATLKNELRKLKGKNVVDTAVSNPIATIAPGIFKLDFKPIAHRLKNNRDAHEVYLDKTIENTDTLRGLVKCARKQYPSKPLLEFACMFTKHIQELLVCVYKTRPSSPKSSEKLVTVTPLNKDKKVRFAEPITSSNNIPKQTDFLKKT
ncbi:hypothetical protein Tco_1142805 [Tanacetum coccineum]